jgi:DNA adenine methylase
LAEELQHKIALLNRRTNKAPTMPITSSDPRALAATSAAEQMELPAAGGPRIRALSPWYGSKRTLAPQIITQLGRHACYWEPFCGSCSILLSKEPATYESVNDLHGDLINLALVVQDPTKSLTLYERAYRTLCCEQFARDAKEQLLAPMPDDLPCQSRAYFYLVHSWFHVNGIAGTPLRHTGSFCVRYSAKGGNGATRWRSVVESIPAWHERLRGVQILSRDAFDLIEKIDDADGTVLYVDPPYLRHTRGAKYEHDFRPSDHLRLSQLLSRFQRARVVLSYYEDPQLRELYPRWSKIDQAKLKVAKSMVNSGMRDGSGRTEAPEVLLVNGPVIGLAQELF